MFRVFGITYDHTINYGSCMQAYALQAAIEKLTVGDSEACSYQLIPIKSLKGWPRGSILTAWYRGFVKFQHGKFVPFEKKHISFVDVSKICDLPGLNQEADAFVCGSDVIWNPDFNYGIKALYLDFAKKYKFSYAASFGKSVITPESIAEVKDALLELDSISVRERSGEEIIRKYLQKEALIVADPVLLLNRTDWERIADYSAGKRKYVFVYATHLNQTIRSFINQLRKNTNYEVIFSAAGPKQAIKLGRIWIQSPEEWLGQLIGAEYVITNSFHATAFSVLFHKKFFTVVSGEKSGGINVRMYDFLNSMALSDRLFNDCPADIPMGEPDFMSADETIARLRADSVAFLQRNLEAAYREKTENNQKET